jgi:hypothetical protein
MDLFINREGEGGAVGTQLYWGVPAQEPGRAGAAGTGVAGRGAPAGSRIMSTGPAVVKAVWTDADFDAMDWHDNAMHAVALEPVPDHPGRLLLDLDNIVEWVAPEPPATTLSFWICPATLAFDRAWDLTTDIDLRGWSFQLSLDAITRSGPDERGISDWTLSGDNFSIALSARGFTQYLRRPPIHSPVSLAADQQRRMVRRCVMRASADRPKVTTEVSFCRACWSPRRAGQAVRLRTTLRAPVSAARANTS